MDLRDLKRRYVKIQFGSRQRERLYLKLATFLKNGMPLVDSLREMYMHASDDNAKPGNPIAVILQDWRRAVGNGAPFGTAVAGWVPEGDRVILAAGEQSGLDQAINDALLIQSAFREMKTAIATGLAYPVVLLLMAIGFMVMFALRIMPSFAEVLPMEKWIGTAGWLVWVGGFVDYWLLPLSVGCLCTVGVVIYSLPRWVGPVRAFADRLPPWSLYRIYAGAGFMLAVSALTRAGVPQRDILRTLQRGATPWYGERISGALRHVVNGKNLGEALWLTRLGFPDVETVRDLRSYAEQDGFDEILRHLGEQWIAESLKKIKSQTSILRNVAFLVFTVVFGTIVSGIFSLQMQVSRAF
jgi:type II secretory pathway component PulF